MKQLPTEFSEQLGIAVDHVHVEKIAEVPDFDGFESDLATAQKQCRLLEFGIDFNGPIKKCELVDVVSKFSWYARGDWLSVKMSVW